MLNIPLSLYIHIPWCVKKCPYCDFNSHQQQGDLPEAAYIQQLVMDMQAERALVGSRPIQSIFFGGGTPTLFSAKAFFEILSKIKENFELAPDCEITVEANPATVEIEKFQALHEMGVNRLSIGVQSFQEKFLNQLGRVHDREMAFKAVESAKRVGFNRFNLDLMHALGGQSIEQALDDLKLALSLGVRHLSWYQLTLEPNTVFYRKPPGQIPNDDLVAHMQAEGRALIQSYGLNRYEVSAYAAPGHQSQHNRNYWTFGDYIGIGAGAHGKLSKRLASGQLQIERHQRTRSPKDYLKRVAATAKRELIADQQQLFEFCLNSFRLVEAIPYQFLHERTHVTAAQMQQALTQYAELGLILFHQDAFQLSEKGHHFIDTLLQDLLPDA